MYLVSAQTHTVHAHALTHPILLPSFLAALFVAGEHDDFINKKHSEQLYERYAGDKNLIIVEGDHNSPRPKFMFDSAAIFLQTCLQIPNHWALPTHPGMNLMAPPWYYPSSSQIKSPSRHKQQHNGGDEMGMTQERQREIQASLFKMLGQAETTNNGDAAAAVPFDNSSS